MGKIVRSLTDTQIRQAKPRDKEYNLADGDGLTLRIKPSGSKTWLFNFQRPYTKRRTNLSFGTYPEVSLADARRQRMEARALLSQNIDPQEHRDQQARAQQQATELTLERVFQEWFELKKASITPGHAEDIHRSIVKHTLPRIGQVPLHKLTAPMAIETLRPLANTGKLEAVKRICQRLNEMMVYGVNTGLIPNNPLAGMRHAFLSPRPVNNPTLRPEELPMLLKTLQRARVRPITYYLMQWQLHTMTRPSEAAGARWTEVDLALGVVKPDPVANHATRVLLRLESMAMNALLFQRPDHSLHHTVLLWAMRRDELLLQAIATHELRKTRTGKNQTII